MKSLLLLIVLFALPAFAQEQGMTVADIQKVVNDTLASKWYDRWQVRGYAHFRYNRLSESNGNYICSQCDGSMGKNKGFFFRRARLVFQGDVTDRVFVKIEPDYSTTAMASNNADNQASPQQNYLNIRDLYFDYALEETKEFRIRVGQQKVPFGFENLQSSGNRAGIDRTDAINMAVPNERDTGMTFFWAPTEYRQMFKDLVANNLKGTGDYGIFALGTYNGQTMNRNEQNNSLETVARVTVPWKTQSGQYYEASIAALNNSYDTNPGSNHHNIYDQRTGASFVMYPQPFGFQAEYNVGTGPEYDPRQNKIMGKNLRGGYAQVNYQTYVGNHRFFPYFRFQEYSGGKKLDNSARAFTSEMEVGSEWQPNPAFELTVAYAKGTRLIQNSPDKNSQNGNLLRLQAQVNF
ncbi:MAG: porin [Bacteriovoracaceae bacterium]